MDEKPRFSVRRKSVALTRIQWVVIAVALAVAIVGLLIALATHRSIGVIVTGVATLTAILVIGFGHARDDGGS